MAKKSSNTILYVGAAAVGAWWLWGRQKAPPSGQPQQTAAAQAPGAAADPSLDPCGTAAKLRAIGRTVEAAYWQQRCPHT